MDKQEELLKKIDEGINNLESRTNFEELDYKELLPFIRTNISNFHKSNKTDFLKEIIDQFHQTAIASREGSNMSNNNIWDAEVEVQGKIASLEELVNELEDLYLKLSKRN